MDKRITLTGPPVFASAAGKKHLVAQLRQCTQQQAHRLRST
jgi:hypothetical protein